MLILSRKKGEQIIVKTGNDDDDIIIEVVEIKGQSVRLGVLARPEVKVDRLEIAEAKKNNPRTLE